MGPSIAIEGGIEKLVQASMDNQFGDLFDAISARNLAVSAVGSLADVSILFLLRRYPKILTNGASSMSYVFLSRGYEERPLY